MEFGAGQCGNCKSTDIEYGESGVDDESYYYKFTCNNCGKTGREWYDLVYSETMMDEDED